MDRALKLTWKKESATTLTLNIGSVAAVRYKFAARKWRCERVLSRKKHDGEQLQKNLIKPIEKVLNGALIFHGALLYKGRRAHVIVAPSGTGKSTLTAYLSQNGWTALTDDMTQLNVKEGYVTARGVRRSIALDRQSKALLKLGAKETRHLKTLFPIENTQTKVVRIQSILFLSNATKWRASDLSAVESMNALIHNTWRPRLNLDSNFPRFLKDVAKLVECVPCEMIQYPKKKSSLEKMRKHLETRRSKGANHGTSSSRTRSRSRR